MAHFGHRSRLACALLASGLLAGTRLAQAANVITVNGNQILNNGKLFVTNGVIFDISAPIATLKSFYNNTSESNSYVNGRIKAYDYFFGLSDPSQGVNYSTGTDAISMLKSKTAPWGVNTIRFNVDQAALNPGSPEYAGYVTEVSQAVTKAEAAGYVVDLALFDERNHNAPVVPFWQNNPEVPLDTATTETAALTLVGLYGRDQNVEIELLNEPFPAGQTGPSWGWWANGGTNSYPSGTYYGDVFVGVNNEIAAMRAGNAASKYVKSINAIIIQGLSFSWQGYQYNVTDPLNRLIYSVHPFFTQIAPNTTGWYSSFGQLSATLPVVLTAWDASTSDPWFNSGTLNAPYQFLNYIEARNIGVVGYGFDVPLTIVMALNGHPTLWPSQVGPLNGGPGQLLQRYWTSGVVPLPQ